MPGKLRAPLATHTTIRILGGHGGADNAGGRAIGVVVD